MLSNFTRYGLDTDQSGWDIHQTDRLGRDLILREIRVHFHEASGCERCTV